MELRVSRYLGSDDVMPTEVHGTGLGTWRCPREGRVVKVVRS
jgi:hypothetical protein